MIKIKRIFCAISGIGLILTGLAIFLYHFLEIVSVLMGRFTYSTKTCISVLIIMAASIVLLLLPGIKILFFKELGRKIGIAVYVLLLGIMGCYNFFHYALEVGMAKGSNAELFSMINLRAYFSSTDSVLLLFYSVILPLFFVIILIQSKDEFK